MNIAKHLTALAGFTLAMACSAADESDDTTAEEWAASDETVGEEISAADDDGSAVGTLQQAFAEETCAQVTNFAYNAEITDINSVEVSQSPDANYGVGGCANSYIGRVRNPDVKAGATVVWADTVPTTESDCVNGFVRVSHYEGQEKKSDSGDLSGFWNGTRCFTAIASTEKIDRGELNHVHARARFVNPSTGAVTFKKVRVTVQGTFD